MQHRVIVSGSNLDIASDPPTISCSAPVLVNVNVTGFGQVFSTSGFRLWDTSIVPVNSVYNLTPSTPLTLPVSIANLPPLLFDAIIVVRVNGVLHPFAFSNSNDPTNATAYPVTTPIEDKKLFWTDLYAINNNPNNNYSFGGDSLSPTGGPGIPINFTEDLQESLTIDFFMTHTTYLYGLSTFIGNNPYTLSHSGSVTLAPGSSRYNLINPYQLNAAWYPPSSGVLLESVPGYFTIKLSTTNPNYRSVLPSYHWSVS